VATLIEASPKRWGSDEDALVGGFTGRSVDVLDSGGVLVLVLKGGTENPTWH
jgi:hypothetical protein